MQAKKSPLHLAAIRYAEAGIPVFPCISDAAGRSLPDKERKKPATPNGFKDATTDLEQIDSWWSSNPGYNIAFSPQSVGLGVVDLDGPEADAAWADLVAKHSIPDTREILTPRGGRHIYFQGELPQTAWVPGAENKRALGVHIDTRGVGSYVLLPPSSVNGKPYKVLHDRPIVPVPGWMSDHTRKRDEARVSSVRELDAVGSRDRGRTLLTSLVSRGDVAISGRGGNNRTYRLACELSDLGLSPEVSRSLLEELWNPHCVPPWQPDELVSIFANAASYVQNETGAYAVAPAAEVFASVNLDRLLPDEKPTVPARSRFYAEDDEEQDNAPDPSWLVPAILPDAATVLLIGAKGSFKSFIAQELLLAVASGVDTFGTRPLRTGPAFYGAHEGRNAIKKPRKQAWKLAHDCLDTKLPFFVMRAPQIKSEEQCNEFREQIRVRLCQQSHRISGIVLDTVAKCMVGLNENDAGDCGLFIAFCDSLRDEFECPVIALHHYGKDATRGGRGSSALPAGFDTVISVDRHEKSWCLSVKVDYHKDADEPDEPWTFEGRKLGPSLVFYPTTAEEHRVNTKGEEVFARSAVGAALRKLGAIGQSNAISTTVLAAELSPVQAGEDLGAHQERVSRAARAIGKLSKTKLAGYCWREGRDCHWGLPAATDQAD